MKPGDKAPQAKRRRGPPPQWTAPADVDVWHEVAKSVAPLPPKVKRKAHARRKPGETVSPAGPPERKAIAPKPPRVEPAPKPPVLPRP
jgi:hypothetical protein